MLWLEEEWWGPVGSDGAGSHSSLPLLLSFSHGLFVFPGILSLGSSTAREEENPAALLLGNWTRAESPASCTLSQRVPAWQCPIQIFLFTFNVPGAIIKQLMIVFVKTCTSFLKDHGMLLNLLCLGLCTLHYSTNLHILWKNKFQLGKNVQ